MSISKLLVVVLVLMCSGCFKFCTLNVENGSGSGMYAPLSTATIAANPAASNTAFAIWSGDISGIGDKTATNTTIWMNQFGKTITALYTNAPLPGYYVLAVNSGSGAGVYLESQVVTIVAYPPPQFEQFDKWMGDTTYVDDATKATANVTMPNYNISISATYKNPSAYVYVAGDKADKGTEVWVGDFHGMDVRLSADDIDNLNRCGIPAKGVWYSLDHDVTTGISLQGAPDGGIIATAQDFTSPRTGAKYHICGYLIGTSSSQLVKSSTVTIPKDQCHNTLRFMFATVQ